MIIVLFVPSRQRRLPHELLLETLYRFLQMMTVRIHLSNSRELRTVFVFYMGTPTPKMLSTEVLFATLQGLRICF
jgi:hypothetical protein